MQNRSVVRLVCDVVWCEFSFVLQIWSQAKLKSASLAICTEADLSLAWLQCKFASDYWKCKLAFTKWKQRSHIHFTEIAIHWIQWKNVSIHRVTTPWIWLANLLSGGEKKLKIFHGFQGSWDSGLVVECIHRSLSVAFLVLWGEPDQQTALQVPMALSLDCTNFLICPHPVDF